MQKVFAIESYPIVINYLHSLNSGDRFRTYKLIELIRGAEIVDSHTPVSLSINASIGRAAKAISGAYGFAEIQAKARHTTPSGKRTCCSIWQKL